MSLFGGEFPTLREFQVKAHEALREGARAGHTKQIVLAPTGAGKTILALNVIKNALERGRRAMFICDRKTLITQTSEVARSVGLGHHGIIQAQNPMWAPERLFQIASCQTLMRRGWPQNMDVIVVDECFPGETMVTTPNGDYRIDEISAGDKVVTAFGVYPVRSTFSKLVYKSVLVRLSDGTKFECTNDHPVFTELGWKPAGSLERGERLFRLQDVSGLWGGVQTLPDRRDGHTCRVSGDRIGIFTPDVLRAILREEVEESDAQPRVPNEIISDLQTAWDRTNREMGQWNGDDPGPGISLGLPGGSVGSRIRREDPVERPGGVSPRLQGGYCQSGIEGCSGSRREQSSFPEAEGRGSEEGCIAPQPWVEGVEVVEYPGGIDVFNLHVAGHPSYFANGALVHNCHTQYKTWVRYVTSPECTARVIGLSATPFSPGLGKIFTNLINAATMAELTSQGILVPMRIFSCRRPDMAGAETSGGEWTDKAAEERELVLVGDVITEWTKLARDKKTIVFGATIKHCEELARQFSQAGIGAAVFCADTDDDDRARILREFASGAVQVLISVEALAKGFDVKDVGAICDCRPLRKSLSTAIQMWGRGLRSSPETGKTECLLLDFSGNIIRFADDFSQVYFNGLDRLDDGEKLDKEVRNDEDKEPKSCPKCGFTPMGKKCIQCGFTPEPRALMEALPGEMQEVRLDNGKVLAPDQIHLYAQLATYAKLHSLPEKQQGRAACLFKDITGKWPPRHYSPATAPWVDPTRNTLNKIKALRIAFLNRRQSSEVAG